LISNVGGGVTTRGLADSKVQNWGSNGAKSLGGSKKFRYNGVAFGVGT